MSRINVSLLKSGMILSEDVKDSNGRKLLSAGEAVTEKHLRVFKIWGVAEVAIEGVEAEELAGDALGALSPERVQAARERVLKRFALNDLEDETIKTLIQCGVTALAKGSDPIEPFPEYNTLPPVPLPSKPVALGDLMRGDLKLGSLPPVFHRLVDVVNDPRSSATDMAEVIANDTDLSARLLRLVNSTFYGLRAKVDTITRAVTVIGSNQLVSLAMGAVVTTFFKGLPNNIVDMRSFWEHSVACGVAAKLLASLHRMPNTERFFVAGLLHDIGRLAAYRLMPDHTLYILTESRRRGVPMRSLEREILGFGHDALGGRLLKEWRCPVSLERNVALHHKPGSGQGGLEAAIMSVADTLAHTMEFGTSGEVLVPSLNKATWDLLGLPVGALEQAAAQMDYQVHEIIRFFELNE
ncbi:HDOD domain-containing protein [Oleidesulfovibrio sp.]|uniref:HDOD domain-containing protein n=1 Tax=Oleidesulfovibrio sp. TaxID=2909707 RepID=UPI003A8B3B73